MGTWDVGILDNDTALDGVAEVTSAIAADIIAMGDEGPTLARLPRLAGAVGVLLQLSSGYDFDPSSPDGPRIAAAVAAWRNVLDHLPPDARPLLDAIAAGHGTELVEARAPLPDAVIALVGKGYGAAYAALFQTGNARAYATVVSERCIAAIEADFAQQWIVTDLCREAPSMGALGVLLIIEPPALPRARLEQWRALARGGIAKLEASSDPEITFHRAYYAKVDAALGALLARA